MVVRSSEEIPVVTVKISPVYHSDYNECGDRVTDSLLE